MIVYRCEDEDGVGPYRAFEDWSSAPQFLRDHNSDMINHPLPREDGIKNLPAIPDGWVCGFASQDQMNSWFTKKEQIALVKLGFRFLKFESDDVRVGNHQCVFHRSADKIIEELKI